MCSTRKLCCFGFPPQTWGYTLHSLPTLHCTVFQPRKCSLSTQLHTPLKSLLLAWGQLPWLPPIPSPCSPGIPGPSQPVTTTLAARSEGAVLPFRSCFSPGYFSFLAYFSISGELSTSSSPPSHWFKEHKAGGALGPFVHHSNFPLQQKGKKKVGEIIFPMRFCWSFSCWCPEYRDGFVAPRFHCGCCRHLGSDPRGSRGGIASNTQEERGSSQHILVNPAVENWKTVPERSR